MFSLETTRLIHCAINGITQFDVWNSYLTIQVDVFRRKRAVHVIWTYLLSREIIDFFQSAVWAQIVQCLN